LHVPWQESAAYDFIEMLTSLSNHADAQRIPSQDLIFVCQLALQDIEHEFPDGRREDLAHHLWQGSEGRSQHPIGSADCDPFGCHVPKQGI